MRRFLISAMIASITAGVPGWALAGDRDIAKAVLGELEQYKQAGHLEGFDIKVKVNDGVVYLTGDVKSRQQRSIVSAAAVRAAGQENVVNDIRIKDPQAMTQVQPASNVEVTEPATSQDMRITDSIYDSLSQAKAAGSLRGFDLDISTIEGDVWIRGSVSSDNQKSLVLDVARRTRGVARVIDEVVVKQSSLVRPVSTNVPEPPTSTLAPVPVPPSPGPVQHGSSMPNMGRSNVRTPQPFAPSNFASHGQVVGGVSAGPAPMQHGAEVGMSAPRYDQPNLPNYAWPSYAAYPNYAAVTYPKQYSPSAWPYIGPFYPYPQVPLGWRKVSLQWDDGLWYLDFTSK